MASRPVERLPGAGTNTEREGWCWFFGAIDHHTDELLDWHTAKLGDRWAALEPIRQGVAHAFGGFAKDLARGLRIRCAWGPQYIADAWIAEVKWLGMTGLIAAFIHRYNHEWLIERLGYRTPAQARAEALGRAA